MTRDEALRRLRKICGTKTIHLKARESLSSPERRAAKEEEFQRVRAEIEAGERRVADIIASNAEIQAIYERRKVLRPLKERLNWDRHYRKFEALKPSGGIGWSMLGQGDTWEEVIQEAEAWEERARKERAEWEARRRSAS